MREAGGEGGVRSSSLRVRAGQWAASARVRTLEVARVDTLLHMLVIRAHLAQQLRKGITRHKRAVRVPEHRRILRAQLMHATGDRFERAAPCAPATRAALCARRERLVNGPAEPPLHL